VVADGNLDLAALRAHVVKQLPDYARPLFLRIQSEIDITGTFKQKKIDLVKQGFDPTAITDPIYFSDPASQSYVRLDQDLYQRIQAGQVRM
jgi:fatty-acyl-CoA synthase